MFEFTVHFMKGTRVGTRSLRMVHVQAATRFEAVAKAVAEFPDYRTQGYRLTRTDYFDPETGRIVRD